MAMFIGPREVIIPLTLPDGYTFYLDAQAGIYSDAGVTPATNGQAIQQINDQSGTGIVATNTNVGFQATYDVGSLNGLNTIRLENDNVNDTYLLSANVNVTNLFTIHWLYKKDLVSTAALILSAGQNLLSDDANGITYLLEGTQSPVAYDGGDDWTVATVVQRKGEVGYELADFYINGVLMAKISNGADPTQAIDRLFQRPSPRTGNYNVGDVLVYGEAQTQSKVKDVQNYINDKYGNVFIPTDTSLPSPPTIGSTILEWYHNPDYNTYSDVAQTVIANTDFVRSNKITTGDYPSLYQHTAASQMQYKTTVLPNGKASYYKGGQDYMFMSDEKVFTSSESFVAYSVHKRTDINGTNAIFGKRFTTNNAIMDWNSNLVYYADASGLSTVSVTHSTNTVVRAYVIDRTAQLFRVYENGVEVNSVDITARTSDTTFDIMFNRNNSGTGTIDHGITLLYRGLHNASNVATVSSWLNNYYGNLIY